MTIINNLDAGLKASTTQNRRFSAACEAVPFQIALMRPVLASPVSAPRSPERIQPEVQKQQREDSCDDDFSPRCRTGHIAMVFPHRGAATDRSQYQEEESGHLQPEGAEYVPDATGSDASSAVEGARPAVFAGLASGHTQDGAALSAEVVRGRGFVLARCRHLRQRRILAASGRALCGAWPCHWRTRRTTGAASLVGLHSIRWQRGPRIEESDEGIGRSHQSGGGRVGA